MSIEVVRHLEDMAARAWPAAEVQPLDGWRLRFADGVTQRANSVWPNGSGGAQPLEQRFAAVEAFYAARGQPALYQISPAAHPDNLDARLALRGYARIAPTSVQTASLSEVLRRTRRGPVLSPFLSADCDDAWFDAYCAAEDYSGCTAAARRGILDRIRPQKSFAQVKIDGPTTGVGLAVVEGEWAGVFCMSTRKEHRRHGSARAVLHALAEWASGRGAAQMYLQVAEGNVAARALYSQAGFATLYGYHYRRAPSGRDRRNSGKQGLRGMPGAAF